MLFKFNGIANMCLVYRDYNTVVIISEAKSYVHT